MQAWILTSWFTLISRIFYGIVSSTCCCRLHELSMTLGAIRLSHYHYIYYTAMLLYIPWKLTRNQIPVFTTATITQHQWGDRLQSCTTYVFLASFLCQSLKKMAMQVTLQCRELAYLVATRYRNFCRPVSALAWPASYLVNCLLFSICCCWNLLL